MRSRTLSPMSISLRNSQTWLSRPMPMTRAMPPTSPMPRTYQLSGSNSLIRKPTPSSASPASHSTISSVSAIGMMVASPFRNSLTRRCTVDGSSWFVSFTGGALQVVDSARQRFTIVGDQALERANTRFQPLEFLLVPAGFRTGTSVAARAQPVLGDAHDRPDGEYGNNGGIDVHWARPITDALPDCIASGRAFRQFRLCAVAFAGVVQA